jgi:hypothetical protein
VQVVYPDKLPAIMQSPHPAVLSDGSMVNFSRVFPFGGSHLYRQDRITLQRKEVRAVLPSCACCHSFLLIQWVAFDASGAADSVCLWHKPALQCDICCCCQIRAWSPNKGPDASLYYCSLQLRLQGFHSEMDGKGVSYCCCCCHCRLPTSLTATG